MRIGLQKWARSMAVEHKVPIGLVGRRNRCVKIIRGNPSFLDGDGVGQLRVHGPTKIPLRRENLGRIKMTNLIECVDTRIGSARGIKRNRLIQHLFQGSFEHSSRAGFPHVFLFLPTAKTCPAISNCESNSWHRPPMT